VDYIRVRGVYRRLYAEFNVPIGSKRQNKYNIRTLLVIESEGQERSKILAQEAVELAPPEAVSASDAEDEDEDAEDAEDI
jgi:hypothetical protein